MVNAQGLSANMHPVDGDIIYFNINYEELKNEIRQRIEEYLWNEEWFRSDIYKYTARELEARQGWETIIWRDCLVIYKNKLMIFIFVANIFVDVC